MITRDERAAWDARDKLYEELASQCTCTPLSNRPCEGLLAGGLCDNLQMGRGSELDDEDEADDCDEQY